MRAPAEICSAHGRSTLTLPERHLTPRAPAGASSAQGGDGHGIGAPPQYPYPKWVWSPTGGWWPNPRKWRINTAVVVFGLVMINVPIYLYSERNQV